MCGSGSILGSIGAKTTSFGVVVLEEVEARVRVWVWGGGGDGEEEEEGESRWKRREKVGSEDGIECGRVSWRSMIGRW